MEFELRARVGAVDVPSLSGDAGIYMWNMFEVEKLHKGLEFLQQAMDINAGWMCVLRAAQPTIRWWLWSELA